ncbi:hypothetical protein C8R43DRAFT_693535 [Mycena crocata]|nr:hypothetical protein C8R43DRAFT_693535 [Mycena crocata]
MFIILFPHVPLDCIFGPSNFGKINKTRVSSGGGAILNTVTCLATRKPFGCHHHHPSQCAVMPEEDKKPKISAYVKRNSNCISAPIELDSDSDFNSGPIQVPVKEKKPRRKSAKSAKRRGSSDSDDSEKPSPKKRKTKKAPVRRTKRERTGDNPLLEFFQNMDLHSDSSEDEPDPMEYRPSDHEEEEEESEADDGPAPTNKFAALKKGNLPLPSPPADDSVTGVSLLLHADVDLFHQRTLTMNLPDRSHAASRLLPNVHLLPSLRRPMPRKTQSRSQSL